MMAVREGRSSTLDLLIARGADVNRRNESGASALDWAKRGKDPAMVGRLQRAGRVSKRGSECPSGLRFAFGNRQR